MKTKLLLFAACVLAPLLARAENVYWPNLKYDLCGSYKVLHINGVDTARTGAEANLKEITAAYGNAHDKHLIHYGLAYNATYKLAYDLIEALDQSIREVPGVSYSDWVRGWVYGIFPSFFPRSQMTAILSKLGQTLNWRKPDDFFSNDMASILADTVYLGFNGKYSRLLIVGHSQGTLFANILARRLVKDGHLKMNQIGLMSIAAFVPILEGTGSQWVTNSNDWPVMYGRGVYADIKGNTVTIPHTEPETYPWRGHNLIGKYLTDPASKSQIIAKMKSVMNGLSSDPSNPETVAPYPPQTYTTALWLNCTPATDCTRDVNGVRTTFTVPIISYGIVNSPNNVVVKPGTMEDAKKGALSQAPLCYQMVLAEEIKRKAAGNLGAYGPYVWGCGAMPNYMSYAGVWHAYSGDLPPKFTTINDVNHVWVQHLAVCRKPAPLTGSEGV